MIAGELPKKRVEASITDQVHYVMPHHLNGAGKLFGGQLVQWIDEVAGIVAQRHCNKRIVTASIDNLQFHGSASLDQTIVLQGKVTYVGNTSLEVRVDSYVESIMGDRILINTAYINQVAIDEEGKPCAVPRLLLQSAQEEMEFQEGKLRKDRRRN